MRQWRVVIGTPAAAGAPHGYGIIVKGIDNALKAHPRVEVLPPLTTPDGWDVRVAVSQVAPWFVGDAEPRDLMWHTMLEVEPFPRWWADTLNRVGWVWAPSQWVADQMRYIGVRRPILVAPYGVDHETFQPVDRAKTRAGEPFTFLAWARGLVSRKHVLDVVRAFARANIPGARLIIKVNGDDEVARGGVTFRYEGRVIENVTVIARDMPRREMAHLLQNVDMLVYPSGGEGLGLMPLEAMATALPVAVMPVTGMTEYANADTVFCLRGRKEPAKTYVSRFGYDCTWYRANIDDIVDVMRFAVEHREDAYRRGWAGYEAAKTFTWERMADRFVQFLDDYGGQDHGWN